MTGERALYCARCGELGEGVSANCPHCGVPRDRSRSARAAGVAFVLNELGASPLTEIITAQQRARISVHYEQELRELVQIQPARTSRQAPALVRRRGQRSHRVWPRLRLRGSRRTGAGWWSSRRTSSYSRARS
jgi:hypothetical protein